MLKVIRVYPLILPFGGSMNNVPLSGEICNGRPVFAAHHPRSSRVSDKLLSIVVH
jgi:hypothetical protein